MVRWEWVERVCALARQECIAGVPPAEVDAVLFDISRFSSEHRRVFPRAPTILALGRFFVLADGLTG